MDNLPAWVAKAISIWTTIGTLLIMFGTKIMDIPDWMPALFSEATVKMIMLLVGTAITVFQYFRTEVFKKAFAEKITVDSAGNRMVETKVLSITQKRNITWNPFSMAA